jgi:hypothetical protein
MKIAGHETHPAADAYPMLSDAELAELAESIKKNGLLQKIILLGKLILDGRNRAVACERAGVEPKHIQWNEYAAQNEITIGPVQWVVESNRRRHMTEEQRIIAAVKLLPMLRAEAAERQKAALKKGEKLPLAPNGADGKTEKTGKAAAIAAEMLGVSMRSLERGQFVMENAKPEVIERIEKGDKGFSFSRVEKDIRKASLVRGGASRAPCGGHLLRRGVRLPVEVRRRPQRLGSGPGPSGLSEDDARRDP